MRWHWSNQNKSRPNIKSDAFKKILWKERERMMHIIELIFDGYLLIFIFRRKGDLTLILVRGKKKNFLLKKDKHVSACMSVLLGM